MAWLGPLLRAGGCSCVLGCSSLPELWVLLQACVVVAEFSSFGFRTDVLFFLLAGCQLGALLAPRGGMYSPHQQY